MLHAGITGTIIFCSVAARSGSCLRNQGNCVLNQESPLQIVFVTVALSLYRERMMMMKTGLYLICQERNRQLSQEGFSAEHDDKVNGSFQLVGAAIAYLCVSNNEHIQRWWPWDWKWWKPSHDRIRNMVKAGALIAAEIDRLQRERENQPDAQEWKRRYIARFVACGVEQKIADEEGDVAEIDLDESPEEMADEEMSAMADSD
jgi:hypothetical protein